MLKQEARFLIVDDFQTVRTILKKLLIEMGFSQIDEAENGREALVKINEAFKNNSKYTLVFCDWNMPEMTGIEVLETCRKSDLMKSQPIIMITAESEQKQIVKAIHLGVNEYILKPFDKPSLEFKIARVLNKLNIYFEDSIAKN